MDRADRMFPEAFLERMQRMLREEYGAFQETFEQESQRALSLNPRKRDRDGKSAAERYSIPGAAFARLSKVPWAENGYYYEASDRPGKHPYHEAGLYYIQEPSAMAPVELLGAEPGEWILDLCAAPGGKSVQIADKLQGEGFLLCNEIHSARAKILSENMERMGIGNACVTNETPEHLAELFPEYFDRVLVDAPCSGEGMFRKNDAACREWSPENVRLCAERQDGILDCAAKMLRPGGRLAYSTCTFAPEENEGSIGRFLRRHEDFGIVPAKKEELGLAGCDGVPEYIEDSVSGLEHALRLWPQRIRGEGHFAAVLQKAGDMPEGIRRRAVNGTVKGSDESALEEFAGFCRGNLRLSAFFSEKSAAWGDILSGLGRAAGFRGEFQCMKFGNHIYLVPPDMPLLKSLKVLRPGLHLGELKKNRFEPSHALALALSPQNVLHIWNLDSDDPTLAAYLNGQTFPATGEKGWYLICVDGFSIGWGKLAGGTMKNHYPRGLRRDFC